MTTSRKHNDKINSDRIIIDLRMQAEDLINSIEHLSEEEYRQNAQKISEQINLRIAEIAREL